jgi:hypothetical protein
MATRWNGHGDLFAQDGTLVIEQAEVSVFVPVTDNRPHPMRGEIRLKPNQLLDRGDYILVLSDRRSFTIRPSKTTEDVVSFVGVVNHDE